MPDQVIRYALGTFGKPTAPVEPWVLDKVLGRPRAAELAERAAAAVDVAELRQRFGARIRRRGAAAALRDAGRARWTRWSPPRLAVTHYNPDLCRCCGCCGRWPGGRRRAELTVDKPGFRLSLRGERAKGVTDGVT